MKLPITKTQLAAYKWLWDHDDNGVANCDHGTVSKGGETAPFRSDVWRKLCERGFVVIDMTRKMIRAIKLDPPLNLSEADTEENVMATQAIAEKHAHVR